MVNNQIVIYILYIVFKYFLIYFYIKKRKINANDNR